MPFLAAGRAAIRSDIGAALPFRLRVRMPVHWDGTSSGTVTRFGREGPSGPVSRRDGRICRLGTASVVRRRRPGATAGRQRAARFERRNATVRLQAVSADFLS